MPPCGYKQWEHLKDILQHLKQNSGSLWPEMEVPHLQEKHLIQENKSHLWMPAFSWRQCLTCMGFSDPNSRWHMDLLYRSSDGWFHCILFPTYCHMDGWSPWERNADFLQMSRLLFPVILPQKIFREAAAAEAQSQAGQPRHNQCSQPTMLTLAASTQPLSEHLGHVQIPRCPLVTSCSSGAPSHQGLTTPFKSSSHKDFPRQNKICPR